MAKGKEREEEGERSCAEGEACVGPGQSSAGGHLVVHYLGGTWLGAVELQAEAPEAAEGSSEPLRDSTQRPNVSSEVGWAPLGAAGACLTQGEGDAGGVTRWEASVAEGAFAGGAEDQGPCEAARLGASEGAGWGEGAGL